MVLFIRSLLVSIYSSRSSHFALHVPMLSRLRNNVPPFIPHLAQTALSTSSINSTNILHTDLRSDFIHVSYSLYRYFSLPRCASTVHILPVYFLYVQLPLSSNLRLSLRSLGPIFISFHVRFATIPFDFCNHTCSQPDFLTANYSIMDN